MLTRIDPCQQYAGTNWSLSVLCWHELIPVSIMHTLCIFRYGALLRLTTKNDMVAWTQQQFLLIVRQCSSFSWLGPSLIFVNLTSPPWYWCSIPPDLWHRHRMRMSSSVRAMLHNGNVSGCRIIFEMRPCASTSIGVFGDFRAKNWHLERIRPRLGTFTFSSRSLRLQHSRCIWVAKWNFGKKHLMHTSMVGSVATISFAHLWVYFNF